MKKILLDKIKNNYKFWKIFFYIILPIFVITFIILLFFLNKNSQISKGSILEEDQTEKIELGENNCNECVPRSLDGLLVNPDNASFTPVALIIDNHIKARPPAGLSRASLVYETEAEGEITRYLAFFDINENIDKIGPIRSARPYFIDWADDLSALLVHCGGSPSALARIIKEDTTNLNQFYQGSYFWRSEENSAPHNIFTSTEKLKKYLKKLDLINREFESWKFKEEDKRTEGGNEFDKIEIEFENPGYEVYWKYDSDKNAYLRFLDDKIHKDQENNEIIAKNLVIQYTAFKVIDNELRLNIDTQGGGDAIVCQDGFCFKAIWKKNSTNSRTRYYHDLGEEEFLFNPGITWVEVVNETYKPNGIYNQIN